MHFVLSADFTGVVFIFVNVYVRVGEHVEYGAKFFGIIQGCSLRINFIVLSLLVFGVLTKLLADVRIGSVGGTPMLDVFNIFLLSLKKCRISPVTFVYKQLEL